MKHQKEKKKEKLRNLVRLMEGSKVNGRLSSILNNFILHFRTMTTSIFHCLK